MRSLAVTAVAAALLLGACGAEADDPGPSSSLEITVLRDDDAKASSGMLDCPGETPNQRDVCAALDVVAPDIFDPVPEDQACTTLYGGPATATIAGTYMGEPVAAEFSQVDGCEVARWNQIEPILKALDLF